jgi:hypothetical protein
VEVWQLSEEVNGPAEGRTTNGRIEIGEEVRGEELWLIAHEYAHWCVANDPLKRWMGLPHLVLEGLAEFAAAYALPCQAANAEASQRELLESVEHIGSLDEVFAIGPREWGDIGNEQLLRTFYVVGFVLAARLGPDGLARSCAEARISQNASAAGALILCQAGMQGASPEEWVVALREAWETLHASSLTSAGE